MLKTIIALIAILSAAFGTYFFIDRTYAKCAKVQLVELRLEQKIQSDSLQNNQERLWELEKRCKQSCSDEDEMEILELRETIEMQKEQLRNILKDYYKGKG